MKHRPFHNQHGVTLVELIVVMIVISVALVGVMSVINYTTLHSADPVLRHQAIAVAEAYMEEIVLKEFRDPDTGDVCPTKEASRDLYDNVCDYNELDDDGARNQSDPGTVIVANYTISVTVAEVSTPPMDGLKIDVTVKDPAGESLTLTGYRADY